MTDDYVITSEDFNGAEMRIHAESSKWLRQASMPQNFGRPETATERGTRMHLKIERRMSRPLPMIRLRAVLFALLCGQGRPAFSGTLNDTIPTKGH